MVVPGGTVRVLPFRLKVGIPLPLGYPDPKWCSQFRLPRTRHEIRLQWPPTPAGPSDSRNTGGKTARASTRAESSPPAAGRTVRAAMARHDPPGDPGDGKDILPVGRSVQDPLYDKRTELSEEQLAVARDSRTAGAPQSSRNATAMRWRAARIAGGTPPTSPITSANASPETSKSGVTRNANARWEKVCQFMAPVVRPFRGKTATQPSRPPTKARHNASKTKDVTTLPVPKPSARMVAISRERSAT